LIRRTLPPTRDGVVPDGVALRDVMPVTVMYPTILLIRPAVEGYACPVAFFVYVGL